MLIEPAWFKSLQVRCFDQKNYWYVAIEKNAILLHNIMIYTLYIIQSLYYSALYTQKTPGNLPIHELINNYKLIEILMTKKNLFQIYKTP